MDGRSGDQNYYYFRYAELLLMYAEAQNEAVEPDLSVYDAVNKVRASASLPNLAGGFNQDQMRTAIRRERRVELVFEDKRLLYLRRWKLAEINLNNRYLVLLSLPMAAGTLTISGYYPRAAILNLMLKTISSRYRKRLWIRIRR